VREIYQVSAPVMGQLLRVEKHAGDLVTGGKTVVADLLPTSPSFLDVRTRSQAEAAVKSADAARNLAIAELRRARAELAFASSDLRRAKGLVAANALARADLERAQLRHDTASALVATAQAALQAKEFDLETAKALLIDPSDTEATRRQRASIPLLAPVSGRILRVLHEDESVVAAGTPIVEIGDPKNLEIVVELISEDAVKVREGAAARITDWGGSDVLNARVRRVEPSGFTKVSALGIEEQRVNVLLEFTDPPEKWAPIANGFRVVAHIVIWQEAAVLQVPVPAMFRSGKGWAVFVVRDGRAVLVPIEVGRSNDETGQVLSGLRAGDSVIVHPSDQVVDGVRVTPRTL
jgi:HlyD family secretion protein